jgi:hypothetical protein
MVGILIELAEVIGNIVTPESPVLSRSPESRATILHPARETVF